MKGSNERVPKEHEIPRGERSSKEEERREDNLSGSEDVLLGEVNLLS
jgi:hypothetical protein